MRSRPTIALLALLLLPAAPGGAAPAPVPAPAPAKSTLLRDDPLLQQRITLEATDRPLGDVLRDLSPTLKADLTVSSQIADQRVTLRLTDQPVYVLLNRLPQLLSHLPEHPRGYYWEKQRPASGRPAFNLWRDLRSVQDEERELDYPRREAAVLLRDVRNLSRLGLEDHAKYKGDYPYILFGADPTDPMAAALKDLSDEQLDALLDGTKIALDPARFGGFLAAAKQKERDQWNRDREVAALDGRADPYPHGFPEQRDIAPVLSVSLEEREGFGPDGKGLYDISISGINYSLCLDVYDTNQSRSPDREPILFSSKPLPGPLVDLTPLLTDKAVTPAQRGDLGFTLQALAKVARLNLYQEDFIKQGATYGYDTPGFNPLKGTLPQLIACICREWDCHAEKVGNDYLFWSRTWAWDRAADIPDRLISKWQARFKKQRYLTLDDHMEIAAALTWPQMTTLSRVLPEGCVSSVHGYTMLRLLGQLAPAEREAAFSDNGLALANAPPQAQQELAADLQKHLKNMKDAATKAGFAGESDRRIMDMTGDQIGQAVLKVEVPPPGMRAGMVGASVWAGGQKLFSGVLGDSLPPAAPPPAASQSTAPPPAAPAHP